MRIPLFTHFHLYLLLHLPLSLSILGCDDCAVRISHYTTTTTTAGRIRRAQLLIRSGFFCCVVSCRVFSPPLMAYVEATSPHTIDTPSLMGAGGIALWIISRVTVNWH